jgi:hypothetical protein
MNRDSCVCHTNPEGLVSMADFGGLKYPIHLSACWSRLLFGASLLSPTAVFTYARNWLSGSAPTNSVVSLMTIFGTPLTAYRRARSGNSVASITSPVTCSDSTDNWWASLAAAGQYGHVGVVKTLMLTSSVSEARNSRVASDKSVAPFDASTRSAMKPENS